MQSRLTKTIIGAVIAIALAVAVSYGYINQQTADQIQTQANQTLQDGQAVPPSSTQRPVPAPQGPGPSAAPRE